MRVNDALVAPLAVEERERLRAMLRTMALAGSDG